MCAQLGGWKRRTQPRTPARSSPWQWAPGRARLGLLSQEPRPAARGPEPPAPFAAICLRAPAWASGPERDPRCRDEGRRRPRGDSSAPRLPPAGGGLVSLFLLCVLIDAPFADGRGTRTPVQVGNGAPAPPPRFGRSPAPALCPVSSWGPAVRVPGRHGHRAACSLHLVSALQPGEPACSFRLLRSRVPHAGCLGGPSTPRFSTRPCSDPAPGPAASAPEGHCATPLGLGGGRGESPGWLAGVRPLRHGLCQQERVGRRSAR